MIDKCIGEKDICDMWQAHYRNLLNSVETSKSKEFVKQELKSITDSSIAFSPVDIFNALKNTKTGKACGVDLLCTSKPGLFSDIRSLPDISDHEIILANCDLKPVVCKKPPRTMYLWNKVDWNKIRLLASEFRNHSYLNMIQDR